MSAADVETKFADALKARDPLDSLRMTVKSLVESGYDRAELIARLEEFRKTLQQQGLEDEEDVVLQVMDFLVGFCSPHMRL
jgi:hypothetical protein